MSMSRDEISKRLAEFIEAIESGEEQIVVRGESKYGKVRWTPTPSHFACLYMPDRRWSEEKQNYYTVEVSHGGQNRKEFKEHLRECLAHPDITITIEEFDGS